MQISRLSSETLEFLIELEKEQGRKFNRGEIEDVLEDMRHLGCKCYPNCDEYGSGCSAFPFSQYYKKGD